MCSGQMLVQRCGDGRGDVSHFGGPDLRLAGEARHVGVQVMIDGDLAGVPSLVVDATQHFGELRSEVGAHLDGEFVT